MKIPDAHRMILVDHSMPYSGVNGKHTLGAWAMIRFAIRLSELRRKSCRMAFARSTARENPPPKSPTPNKSALKALVSALGVEKATAFAELLLSQNKKADSNRLKTTPPRLPLRREFARRMLLPPHF